MARALSSPTRLTMPTQGVDGRTILAKASAPAMTDGRIGDFLIDTVAKKLYGPKTAAGWPDNGLIKGDEGWTAVLAVVADGARRVVRIVDWTGGDGTKPATGQYVGAAGLVSLIADAVDIRGAQGPEMLIEALATGADDVTYETLTALAEDGDDNLRHPLKHLAAAGGSMTFPGVAEAAALAVPARVKTVTIMDAADADGGPGHVRSRVDAEPAEGPKHRSLDRFTSDGGTDFANGGWWLLSEQSAVSISFRYKDGGSFPRPLYKRLRERLSIKDIHRNVSGEAGDDCTPYLQEFIEELRTTKVRGTMPWGTYDTTDPLDGLRGDGFTLLGDNKHSTWINYTGPALTSSDDFIVRLGDPETPTSNYIARGFGVKSAAAQTIGYDCRVENINTASIDLRLGDGATRNCFGGFRVTHSNYVNLLASEVATHGPKLAASDAIELYAPEMRIFGELVGGVPTGGGVILGGGIGGFYYGGSLLYCQGGFLVDKSLSSAQNNQMFIDTSSIDSCSDYLFKLDDDTSDPVAKFIELAGWMGSCTAGEALWIKAWTNSKVHLTGGGIVFTHGNGIRIDDPTVRLRGDDDYAISEVYARPGVAESGYGIYASVPVVIDANFAPENCETAPLHANVTLRKSTYGTNRWMFDRYNQWANDCTLLGVPFDAGADVTLPAGSGIMHLSILETGDAMTFDLSGGGVNPFTANSTLGFFEPNTETPSAGHWSVKFTDARYHVYSNLDGLDGTKTLMIGALLKSRESI